MDTLETEMNRIRKKIERGERLSEREWEAWKEDVCFRMGRLREDLSAKERVIFAQKLDMEFQNLCKKWERERNLSDREWEILHENLVFQQRILERRLSKKQYAMLDQERIHIHEKWNRGEQITDRELDILGSSIPLPKTKGERLSEKHWQLWERKVAKIEAEIRNRRNEAEEQRKRLQEQEVPRIITEAIQSEDKLVHCIKTPTGSGKTHSIIDAVCEYKDKAFTIFVRSHKQMDEYERKIKLESGQVPYHHRGIGGRKECPSDLRQKFNQAFAGRFRDVAYICETCPNKDSCDVHNLKFEDRFRPFVTERIVLAPHILFPLVSRQFRRWKSKTGYIDRIFVVDENYFDTLRLPRSYNYGKIAEFQGELRNFCDDGGLSFPEFEELIRCISGAVVKAKKGYEEIPALKEDFRISDKTREKWFKYFQERNKTGTVFNLLFEFESGVRNGVLVTNPRHKTPGACRDYQFTFTVDTYEIPPLKNKLIITDATFKENSETYLSEILKIPKEQINIRTITEEKPLYLQVYHYPFCNAPTTKAKKNLSKVKAWIDEMIRQGRMDDGFDWRHANISPSTPRRSPSSICIVSYQSYQKEAGQDGELGNSVSENIIKHIKSKYPNISLIPFHYGDESGYDDKEAHECDKVLVIGKFQMPADVIQALFLNTGRDLGCRADRHGNVRFNHDELQKEFDYYTFRSSYQGASRARFFNGGGVDVHILSREDIPNTWKDVIDVGENYRGRRLEDYPNLMKEFLGSAFREIVEVAEKILRSKGYCYRKDIYEKVRSEPTVRRSWEKIKLYFFGRTFPGEMPKAKHLGECLVWVEDEEADFAIRQTEELRELTTFRQVFDDDILPF